MAGRNPEFSSGSAEAQTNAGQGSGRASPETESPTQRPTALERDAQPFLPTSGQVLGVIVRRMELSGDALNTKTAQRYFSGQRVKDSSKAEVLAGVAKALLELGLIPTLPISSEGHVSHRLAESALQWHATEWDRIRSYLRPRMARVQPGHLGLVRKAFLRLAVIDLALRLAAGLHVAGTSPDALQVINQPDRTRRGQFLNQRRAASGVSLERLADRIGVTDNAVDAWMYQGVRPSDHNLLALSEALSLKGDSSGQAHLLAELRRFYWASDLVEVLRESLDGGAIKDLLGRLRTYAGLALDVIDGSELDQAGHKAIVDLAFLGGNAPIGGALLTRLLAHEVDSEWREDLAAASGDWKPRVLTAIYRIDQEEVAAIDHATGGRLLQSWDVSSPEAYRHYQRSMELQYEGRTREALLEVAKAIELDPLDPANHCSMGSMLGGIGNLHRNPEMVKKGLEECRLASSLDPKWILPWAEIGYILVGAGRPRDAVTHLLRVHKDCGPLDTRYYMALALAHQAFSNYAESLAAFEQALHGDPENLALVVGAGVAAVLHGDRANVTRHAKEAQQLGAADVTSERLAHMAMLVSEQVNNPDSSLL